MDVRIRERLIGALVLVAAIVLLVPAVLKGPRSAKIETGALPAKSVEVDLTGAAVPADSDKLVPEPEIAQATPATSPTAPPAPTAPEPPPSSTATTVPQEAPAPPPAVTQIQPEPAWAVQLGAFSSRSKAEGLVTKLRSRGYAAFVLEYRAGGQLLHRVRVGPEQDRARAVAIADRLRKDGFQPVVAPHP